MFTLNRIIRSNIKRLIPYSSARHDFKGKADIFLDANENPIGSATATYMLNRYPDPLQTDVKRKIAQLKKTAANNIFLGNGSDEAIDILIRAFCNPGKDSILVMPPTYGMYEVAAQINDVGIKRVNLTAAFRLNLDKIIKAADSRTKLIFVCSPNNPTGTVISHNQIKTLLKKFNGIVVIDEAYIDFTDAPSTLQLLPEHPNLVILQTFSKAWGMAGLRVGMAFASKEIVDVMNKIKAPYNVGELSQKVILQALKNRNKVKKMVEIVKTERTKLEKEFAGFSFIKKVIPSEANFILIKTAHPDVLYNHLTEEGIVVRNRASSPLCEGGLRITVGAPEENKKLLSLFRNYERKTT